MRLGAPETCSTRLMPCSQHPREAGDRQVSPRSAPVPARPFGPGGVCYTRALDSRRGLGHQVLDRQGVPRIGGCCRGFPTAARPIVWFEAAALRCAPEAPLRHVSARQQRVPWGGMAPQSMAAHIGSGAVRESRGASDPPGGPRPTMDVPLVDG